MKSTSLRENISNVSSFWRLSIDHVLGNEIDKVFQCSFLNMQIHGTQNKCLQILFFNNPNKFFCDSYLVCLSKCVLIPFLEP